MEASFTFKFLQRSTCGLPRSFCRTGDEQRITLIALKNCSSNRKKKRKRKSSKKILTGHACWLATSSQCTAEKPFPKSV